MSFVPRLERSLTCFPAAVAGTVRSQHGRLHRAQPRTEHPALRACPSHSQQERVRVSGAFGRGIPGKSTLCWPSSDGATWDLSAWGARLHAVCVRVCVHACARTAECHAGPLLSHRRHCGELGHLSTQALPSENRLHMLTACFLLDGSSSALTAVWFESLGKDSSRAPSTSLQGSLVSRGKVSNTEEAFSGGAPFLWSVSRSTMSHPGGSKRVWCLGDTQN